MSPLSNKPNLKRKYDAAHDVNEEKIVPSKRSRSNIVASSRPDQLSTLVAQELFKKLKDENHWIGSHLYVEKMIFKSIEHSFKSKARSPSCQATSKQEMKNFLREDISRISALINKIQQRTNRKNLISQQLETLEAKYENEPAMQRLRVYQEEHYDRMIFTFHLLFPEPAELKETLDKYKGNEGQLREWIKIQIPFFTDFDSDQSFSNELINYLANFLSKNEVPDNSEELDLWWTFIIHNSFKKLKKKLLTDLSNRDDDDSIGHCQGMIVALSAGSRQISTGVFIQKLMEIQYRLRLNYHAYSLLGQFILDARNDFPKLINLAQNILNIAKISKVADEIEMEIDEQFVTETPMDKTTEKMEINEEMNEEAQKQTTLLGKWAWSAIQKDENIKSIISPKEVQKLGKLITREQLRQYNQDTLLVYKWQQISKQESVTGQKGLTALAKTLSQFTKEFQNVPPNTIFFELILSDSQMKDPERHSVGIGMNPPSFSDPNDTDVVTHQPIIHLFSTNEEMIEYVIFWIGSTYPGYDSFVLNKILPNPNPKVELVRKIHDWKQIKARISQLDFRLLRSHDAYSLSESFGLEITKLKEVSKILIPMLQAEIQRINQKKQLIIYNINLTNPEKNQLTNSYNILLQENINLLNEVRNAA